MADDASCTRSGPGDLGERRRSADRADGARRWGTTLQGDRATFRLWAPSAQEVGLALGDAPVRPMEAVGHGWYWAEAPARAGMRYAFEVDGLRVPDPAARAQAQDVHGPSALVDPAAYPWRNTAWRGRPWHETVLYELHVGAMGGFEGVRRALPRLRDLGITTLQMMPLADFPGERNWGYDGVLPFAPDAAYGPPDALRALVDEAHGLGLSVMLDVVFNHFGPDGAYLHAYAKPFFDETRSTPWGAAIDFRQPAVQAYFEECALAWLQEYRLDGLRLDAVHAIGDRAWLERLARRIRAEIPDRHVHLVLENEDNAASLLGPGLYDAQWNDDGHNVLHPMLTGEREGYYADFADAPAGKLARVLAEGFLFQGEAMPHLGHARGEVSAHLPPHSFVLFLQNHDQVGNRAMGERLVALALAEALHAASLLLLLGPQVPMLFMGEEWGASAPFLFFVAFPDPALADAVREGRRREFAQFRAFADKAARARIPDPTDPATFTASIPDPAEAERPPHDEILAWHRRLLEIRHRAIVPRLQGARSLSAEPVGPMAVLAHWRMGDGATLGIAINLAGEPVAATLRGEVLAETEAGHAASLAAGTLPPWSAVAVLDPAA